MFELSLFYQNAAATPLRMDLHGKMLLLKKIFNEKK